MSTPRPAIRVPRRVLDFIEDDARKRYAADEEACGYVTGPGAEAVLADEPVALPNLANRYHALDPETYPRTGRMYFIIDPMKFAKAVSAGAAAGRPVRILYHSHLDVGAYFSETDAAAATMGGDAPTYEGLYYLVTSVRAQGVDDHKLFVWDAGTKAFVETPMVVLESS